MTNHFGDLHYTNTVVTSLTFTTNDTAELLNYALFRGKMLYQPGYEFTKVGVLIFNRVPSNQTQTSLFDDRDRERSQRLMNEIDRINHQFEADTIRYAATGLQ